MGLRRKPQPGLSIIPSHGYKALLRERDPVPDTIGQDFGNPDRIGESERVIAVKSLVPVVPLSDLRGDVSLEEAQPLLSCPSMR
jgi:hypothetical protein